MLKELNISRWGTLKMHDIYQGLSTETTSVKRLQTTRHKNVRGTEKSENDRVQPQYLTDSHV